MIDSIYLIVLIYFTWELYINSKLTLTISQKLWESGKWVTTKRILQLSFLFFHTLSDKFEYIYLLWKIKTWCCFLCRYSSKKHEQQNHVLWYFIIILKYTFYSRDSLFPQNLIWDYVMTISLTRRLSLHRVKSGCERTMEEFINKSASGSCTTKKKHKVEKEVWVL